MRRLMMTLFFLVIFLLGFFLLVYLFQERLIFFPAPLPSETQKEMDRLFPGSLVEVATGDGAVLRGWWVRSARDPQAPLLIYYGGNAEEVSGSLMEFNRLEGFQFLFMNYRGYGQSEGRPGERELFSDAIEIFDEILKRSGVRPRWIVLVGRSLGSAVALRVASERGVDGLILITPLDSLKNVGRHHYPFLPVSLLIKHPFDSLARAARVRIPLLVLAAGSDSIIPVSSSRNLFDHYSGKKRWVLIAGADHNDIQFFKDFWEEIAVFLKILS